MKFWQSIEFVNNLITILILVMGVIWLFCKTWILEYIKSKFSEAVNKEIDVHRHALNKDIEAYKNSLIRELEQYRANIDIKRSIAMKIALTELETLQKLMFSLDEYNNNCISTPRLTPELRQENQKDLLRTIKSVRNMHREAMIFLTAELNIDISTYISNAINLTSKYSIDNPHVADINDPELVSVNTEYSTIHLKLLGLIKEIPSRTLISEV